MIHRIFPLYGLLNFALSLWQNQCKITSIRFVVAHDIRYRMCLLFSMCHGSPLLGWEDCLDKSKQIPHKLVAAVSIKDVNYKIKGDRLAWIKLKYLTNIKWLCLYVTTHNDDWDIQIMRQFKQHYDSTNLWLLNCNFGCTLIKLSLARYCINRLQQLGTVIQMEQLQNGESANREGLYA